MPSLRRSEAEELLEELRRFASVECSKEEPQRLALAIRGMLNRRGIALLTRCDGEAHENPNIDHCAQCGPRWGWIGEDVKIR